MVEKEPSTCQPWVPYPLEEQSFKKDHIIKTHTKKNLSSPKEPTTNICAFIKMRYKYIKIAGLYQ